MKIIKLEKPKKEKEPLIRITYKNWLGKIIVRDVVKSNNNYDEWSWYDTNKWADIDCIMNHFWSKSDENVLVMNEGITNVK